MKNNTMKNIMVIGSTCVDIIINMDHLPKTEEDIHPTGQSMALGGCAYNTASMIKLFQAPVTLLSPVGTGFYGEYVEKELRKHGFDIAVRVTDQENGCCYCLVEKSGERTFMSCHGAEYTFQKRWMEAFQSVFYEMYYVCGLEIEEPTGMSLIEYLEEQFDSRMPGYEKKQLFYAPGPRGIRISEEKNKRLYALHPVLHINETEALELSGCLQIPQAAETLYSRTGNTVIITLGEKGTYCLEAAGKSYTVPGFSTEVNDTIGAGDAHIGAVMACLSKGMACQTAIKNANLAAAMVVGSKGATLSKEEFDKIRF